MSKTKIFVKNVVGLGYALTQLSYAVALTVGGAVADAARSIRREIELEDRARLVEAYVLALEYARADRGRRAEEALDRVAARATGRAAAPG